MYRHRNLDIFIAGGIALLGGAAYELHAPGPAQVVLGIALFFAPGYLWSEAILTQRLTGLERAMTSGGIALILPVLGGFLFYGLKIPLFRSSWVGLLVVLTLLGLVAVAVQRLREVPADPRDPRDPRNQPPPRRREERAALSPLNLVVYALAAVVGLGTVAFSVKNADAQKFPGTSALSMTPPLINPPLTNYPVKIPPPPFPNPTKANLVVTNHEGTTEDYRLKLYRKKKLINTWNFTLTDGQTWARVIAYSVAQGDPILADLYLLPDTTKPVAYVDNGE